MLYLGNRTGLTVLSQWRGLCALTGFTRGSLIVECRVSSLKKVESEEKVEFEKKSSQKKKSSLKIMSSPKKSRV